MGVGIQRAKRRTHKRGVMSDDEVTPSSPSLLSIEAWTPFLLKTGTVVVGLVVIAAGLLYKWQDSLLYFPEIGGVPRRPASNPRRYRSPAEHKIPYETHMIPCEDGVSVHSWLLLHPHSKEDRLPTIVFFHGNAGNIGLRLPNAIQMFNFLNANVLMVEYRGFGDSDDVKPDEAGLKLDAQASLRFVASHPMIDPTRIFLFGRSLGGAVAFHLAQHAERNGVGLAGVVVENTFLSVAKMVDHLMPLVAPLKPLVLRIGWDSHRIVSDGLRVPVLYLAGSADQLVPHSHMRELYRSSSMSSACARMHVIKDGTHNETWLQGGREYWEKIRSFFAEAVSAEKSSSFRGAGAKGHGGALGEHVSVDEWDRRAESSPGIPHKRVAVGMGTEPDVPRGAGSSAIPIMPGNLVGMAREAGAAVASNKSDLKKSK